MAFQFHSQHCCITESAIWRFESFWDFEIGIIGAIHTLHNSTSLTMSYATWYIYVKFSEKINPEDTVLLCIFDIDNYSKISVPE